MLAVALFALISCAVAQNISIVPREVTIDAAFRYEGKVFLISGDEFMAVSSDGFETYVKIRLGDSEVPVTEDIKAAVTWPNRPLVYFFCPEFSYRNNQTSKNSKQRPYGRKRQFLQQGGPDAAAFKSGTFYIFRGCRYVAQTVTLWHLGEEQPLTSLGLPCDIDAAWTDEDTRGMTILKGDQIWRWRGEGPVTGPTPFHETYHIWTWRLGPLVDDRFHL